MTVKQRNLDTAGLSTRADRDVLETGVVDEEVIALSGVWYVRLLAFLLVVGTTFGTFVPLAGGWTQLRAGIDVAQPEWWDYFATPWGASALGGALIVQGLLMWGQWSAKTNLVLWWRRVRWASGQGRADGVIYAMRYVAGWLLLYVVLLLVSATPSTYTYAVWTQPLYADLEQRIVYGVILAIFTLTLIGDIIPEVVLVRRAPPPPEQEEE